MLLRRTGFPIGATDTYELSLVGMLTLREGRGVEGEVARDLGFVMMFVIFVESSSMMLDDGERARDLSPVRGLGVREGVGRPFTALMRFSGVKDKGRRLRLAGRCRDVGALMTPTAGAFGKGISGLDSCALVWTSSSSSSSSTNVWS